MQRVGIDSRAAPAIALLCLSILASDVSFGEQRPSRDGLPLTLYKMTFHDEFDTLDVASDVPRKKGPWTDHLWYGGPAGGKQCYGRAGMEDNPFKLRDGVLHIVAVKRSKATCKFPWTSGVIASVNKNGEGFSQMYGYFEIRAKLPTGRGFWPAFWLINVSRIGGGAPSAEIDVMEAQGSDLRMLYTTIHTSDGVYAARNLMLRKDIGGPNWQNRNNRHRVQDMSTAYHTYGLLWDERRLTFYLDRMAVLSLTTPADFHQPMYVIANLDIGGWTGMPDETTPNEGSYDIDYIRVYSRAPSAVAAGPNPERDSSFIP